MKAKEILKAMIAFPTITPQECGIYQWIKEFLGETFYYEDYACQGVKNLFAFKDFNPQSKRKKFHLCFAGHIDVVPAGGGWNSDPFIPLEREGLIYGRGAQDMKGGISAFLSAIKQFQPKSCDLIVSILLTSDEEGEALYGTRFVLETLQKKDFLPDLALVAEPTSEVKIADYIKVGRRGSINGVLVIEGRQGHAAYPQKCLNPIELLGSKLGEIAGKNLDEGDAYFEPSQIVITDMRGGMEVCNVTPSELKLMFNVRNSPLSNEENLRAYLQKVLDGIPHTLTLKTSSVPFLTQSSYFQELAKVVEGITGYKSKPSTSGGTSDARYFALFDVEVLELGVQNDTIHSSNECVKISDLEILEKIFLQFLQKQGEMR